MNIIFCTSEMYPYAKSGGLGDVAASLPEALRKKNKVYTLLPLYQTIDREKYSLTYAGITFHYRLQDVNHQFDIFTNPENPFELFIYNPILCDRNGFYNDENGEFGDNALRFGLFSYACIELMLKLPVSIDIVHVNDWQTALIPLLLKTKYFLPHKTVLTIHNLAYQGIFPKSVMEELHLSWEECFKPEALEYFDHVNFLKGGIYFSDKVTTVSPTYASEIQTPLFGQTLEKTLQNNNYKLQGILNGISYETFDPSKDPMIFKNYDHDTFIEEKFFNKKKLLKELGFIETEKPLFIFIGRFTHQKGIDLLIESFNLFKNFEAYCIVLGSGEDHYNRIFHNISVSYPNVYIKVGYDEAFSRKLYAAADFLLMPSHFEPCGLNQMISMKYGALPIVAKTGGLKDSVLDFTDVDYTQLRKYSGIGITYEEHNILWFMHAIAKGLSLYGNSKKYQKIIKHNMKVDYSWKNSANEYISIYKSILS